MDKDYSEFKHSEYDVYRSLRSSQNNVTLDYFVNDVRFDAEDKTFSIFVDDTNEYDTMQSMIDEYGEENAKRTGIPYKKYQSSDDLHAKEVAETQRMYDRLKSRYDFELGSPAGLMASETDIIEEPLINVFSGARIKLNYGEGILDFIYADFRTPFKGLFENVSIIEALRKVYASENTAAETEKIDDSTTEKPKVYSHDQEIIEDFNNYEDTFYDVRDVAYASLYSAICPPLFAIKDGNDKAMLKWYCNYLLTLQKEYKEMIEFCYDEDFYPEVLGNRYPSERLGIYRRIHDLPSSYTRKECVEISRTRYGKTMPYGLSSDEMIKRLTSTGMAPTEKEIQFAKDFNYPIKSLDLLFRFPLFMGIHYSFRSIADILELEFTKMLEQNVRFRKCKRCGKYFIMKGNYDTNYCDRIAEGETRNCQELAAIENYKAKIADNQAIQIYNKYYKRYAARVRVRQIKEADFKKWKYEAMSKRDECSDGIISIVEYTEWMESSFPNRKRKTE